MKQKGYQTNAEYIESMMKQFKLVDMREQYRDLILEAESSDMDYESFLVRLLSVEEEGKRGRRTEKLAGKHALRPKNGLRTLTTDLTSHWTGIRSRNSDGWISLMLVRMSSLSVRPVSGKV